MEEVGLEGGKEEGEGGEGDGEGARARKTGGGVERGRERERVHWRRCRVSVQAQRGWRASEDGWGMGMAEQGA